MDQRVQAEYAYVLLGDDAREAHAYWLIAHRFALGFDHVASASMAMQRRSFCLAAKPNLSFQNEL
jgi:hypothetical protein